MFEISEKLILEQSDEIYGVTPTNWEDSSWKQLSLVSDEEVISLSRAKVSCCAMLVGYSYNEPEQFFLFVCKGG